MAKITKWKIKPKRHDTLANAPIDRKIQCRECGSPVQAKEVKEITDLEVLIVYPCTCGLITKRLYQKAPDLQE